MTRTIDFSRYASIKIGPIVDVAVIDDIIKLPKDTIIIGGANNLLVSPSPPPLAMLSKKFATIMIEEDRLHIGGAAMSGRIHSFCKKHDIAGFEYLSKLPGTLGGLIKMNAGMKEDEIFNSLLMIQTAKGWIKKEDIVHGYRFADIHDVVYAAVFSIQQGYAQEKLDSFASMRDNQPAEPSAGSAFKNPKGDYAGRLIEAVGLKGVRQGGAMFSTIHANFLVNMGDATFEDALFLINLAKEKVYKEFGIRLENEVQIV
jgi:UDP-N-acetylmuramate dehydrogenase